MVENTICILIMLIDWYPSKQNLTKNINVQTSSPGSATAIARNILPLSNQKVLRYIYQDALHVRTYVIVYTIWCFSVHHFNVSALHTNYACVYWLSCGTNKCLEKINHPQKLSYQLQIIIHALYKQNYGFC